MKKIYKAVFPVAGMGTRFLPATKANPKEMMPIVDKPLIQYAVEEALAAGITDLIFVTSSAKRAIEDHFDSHFELETKLERQGREDLSKMVKEILPKGVSCIYIRQPEALGLGHAILCAKNLIGSDPFAVLLADDLIYTKGKSCLEQMVDQFNQVSSSIIAVEEIEPKDCSKYGIVGFDKPFKGFGSINQIIEKPSLEKAPSNFGVVGRYILTPEIFEKLQTLKSGFTVEGHPLEIQLTDAIAKLLPEASVYAQVFNGKRYDCGSKLGYLKAIIAYGVVHPEVGAEFKKFLNSTIETVYSIE